MSETRLSGKVRTIPAIMKYRVGDDSIIWLEFEDANQIKRRIIFKGKVVWGEEITESEG